MIERWPQQGIARSKTEPQRFSSRGAIEDPADAALILPNGSSQLAIDLRRQSTRHSPGIQTAAEAPGRQAKPATPAPHQQSGCGA